MRIQHFALSALLTMIGMIGYSQAYISSIDGLPQESNDITLTMSPKQPSETLEIELGGYLQEDIKDIIIMTEVGLNLKSWEAIESKAIVLDLSELDRQKAYLLRLKTSSGEILIERFTRV